MIIGIDPGPEESGFVTYSFNRRVLISHGTVRNENLIDDISGFAKFTGGPHFVCLEMPENFGHVVPNNVFETVWIAARIYQKLIDSGVDKSFLHRIRRTDIKQLVLGKRAGKNSDIRAAMIARYGDTLKKTEKTYKLKAHEWQAFAAAEALWLKLKEEA